MNSKDLFRELNPAESKIYLSQVDSGFLNFNRSEMYSTLIKDAARCEKYNSDIVYDIEYLQEVFDNFHDWQAPIWIGFRNLGVDNTDYVLCRCCEDNNFRENLEREYFALYSVSFETEDPGWVNVVFSKYNV